MKIVPEANNPPNAFLVTFRLIVKVIGALPEILKTGALAGEEVTCDIVAEPLVLWSELATYSIPVGKVIFTFAEEEGKEEIVTVRVPASKFLFAKFTGSSAITYESIVVCAITFPKEVNSKVQNNNLKKTFCIVLII